MDFQLIDESSAPKPPKAQSKKASDTVAMLKQLKPGKVLKVAPEEGQSLRGLRSGITRIGRNNEINLVTWQDNTHAYVRLAD
jgi:hypothetical protein